MKPTTLIEYLKDNDRIITMINELYGTKYHSDTHVRCYEPIYSSLPHLIDTLCCRIGDMIYVVSETKYHLHHFVLLKMMKNCQHVLMCLESDELKDAAVQYIILDSSAEASLEPPVEMIGVSNGYSILNLTGNTADVFDISYDEENMPYALTRSKILRDYAAWAQVGQNLLKSLTPYSRNDDLLRWAQLEDASCEGGFEPYAFADKDAISEAFDEWALDLFIRESRNEAYQNGCAETKRCFEKAHEETKD